MLILYINVRASHYHCLSTDVFGDGMAFVALSCVHTLNLLHLLSFNLPCVKVTSPCINEINRLRTKFQNDLPQIEKIKGKKRKIEVTCVIDDGELCSKNAKVFVSHVRSTSNSTVSSNKQGYRFRKSNCPTKSKICVDNALNQPCPKKRKVDVDSSTDNSALASRRPKMDDKLIVSLNLKDKNEV
uniref:Uncharacterized protein n=1 Tax=Amphimedon queenslandica TaxID=400682 RepID=A0A1X7VEU3_AMPQE